MSCLLVGDQGQALRSGSRLAASTVELETADSMAERPLCRVTKEAVDGVKHSD